MSVTQDEKIRQVTDDTLVVGVDIASETHWARAFDWRGLEIGKITSFENDADGFAHFAAWLAATAEKGKKSHIIIGAEPTGHYWFTLAVHLKSNGITLVLVNPHHVKKSKELDDNHPGKSDRKDPKTIAKLVLEGRWSEPYIPEGVYAELRVAVNLRWRIQRELTMTKNQIHRWLKIYFPEHRQVFGKFDGAASMAILKEAPLPQDLVALGADGITAVWQKMKLRAVGKKRAQALYESAKVSVGCVDGTAAARLELSVLLEDYDAKSRQNTDVMTIVETLCSQLPEVAELLKIKGVGLVTVAGFLAEVGDMRRFDSPRQIQKLAGLAIAENSSGKHKGQTAISRRGRARLRMVLFQMARGMVKTNAEFRELHLYYTTRAKNPLKKMQSIIALCCKLIRVFHVLTVKGCAYDPAKLLSDIHRNQPQAA